MAPRKFLVYGFTRRKFSEYSLFLHQATSKNTDFPNVMIQKFQIVKISGTSYYRISHWNEILREFGTFCLMGTQFPRGLPRRREAEQGVRQVSG